jgi:hypothetical protein
VRRLVTIAVLILGLFAVIWLSRRDRAAVPDAPAVLTQVRQLNQLATVRYTIQKVVGIREPKYPVGEESILLVIQAYVDAGVDLSGLTEREVEVQTDGTVTLRLPEARVLNVSLNEKQTQVWDRRMTWWTPWVPYSRELETRARQQGIESAKQAAVEMGILRQAEQNAESAIRGLLGLAGVRRVQIVPARIT